MKKSVIILVAIFACNIASFAQKAEKSENKVKQSTTSEVTLNVAMSCDNCVAKVKKQLAFTKGVKEVEPSLEKQNVVIKYKNDQTDSQKLIESLDKIGYKATVAKSAGCCSQHKAEGCNHEKMQK
ncbi:MAG: cation transporter [Bacteroidales bacterium]|jgi:Cu2+-exporting ATPase|nr:cation transporter [Bacteroidales bacterium]